MDRQSDKSERRVITTIKGKARIVDLKKLGLPKLQIGIISSGHGRGHKQVEITLPKSELTEPSDAA